MIDKRPQLQRMVYEHAQNLLDAAVKEYSGVEQDLWNEFVDRAKAGDAGYFTDLVARSGSTEQDFIDTVLAKDAILAPFRREVIRARTQCRDEINQLDPASKKEIKAYGLVFRGKFPDIPVT